MEEQEDEVGTKLIVVTRSHSVIHCLCDHVLALYSHCLLRKTEQTVTFLFDDGGEDGSRRGK